VGRLTGNPLQDEKKYGSLHIALGDNIDMGGKTESRIHCDIVCLSPEVLVDGKTILRDGTIVLASEDWLEDYRTIAPLRHWQDDLKVGRTATEAWIDPQGRLKRLWDTSSGRVCSVPVGNNVTATVAAGVYQLIEDFGQRVTLVDLAHRLPHLQLSDLLRLTYVLKSYDLITIQDSDM
jgi:hypothetical protein